MARRLSDYQLSVLNWISDGCPDGVWVGESHKVSAAALRSRGLVHVSRSTGSWSATVTEAGRYYLAHDRFPPKESTGTKAEPSRTPRSREARSRAAKPSRPVVPRSPVKVGPTADLVARVVAAGGRLEVDAGWTTDSARYDTLIGAANRYNKCPPGTRLKRSYGRDGSAIYLEDISHWSLVELDPITVPDRLTRPHTAVAELRNGPHLKVAGAKIRTRALRLLQALVVEAQARGYGIRGVQETSTRYGYRERESRDDVIIIVEGHQFGLRLTQQHDREPHEPTPKELREQVERTWAPRIPKYNYTPSSRLTISVTGRFETRQSQWSESPRTFRLEDKLAEILQEIELRADAEKQAATAAERSAEQRRVDWENAIAHATRQAVEHHFATTLEDQATRWAHAHNLMDYIDSMQHLHDHTDDLGIREAMAQWIQWSRDHVTRIKPTRTEMNMQTRPTPTSDDIRPFLEKKWGTHGPDSPW